MSWLPQWVDDLILPKSYAESVVDSIYGAGGTLSKGIATPDPTYDPADLSSPNVYVQAKGAVKSAVASVTGDAKMWIIYAAAFLLLLAFVYGKARS
jgi:hypothetical protein